MALLRSAIAFLLASLFIISLYITINAFTFGDKLHRDSIEAFFHNQTTGANAPANCENICSAQVDQQSCQSYCNTLIPDNRPSCIEACQMNTVQTSQTKQLCVQNCLSNSNEMQEAMATSLDSLYNRELIEGITLDNVTSIFSNGLLFLIITALLGLSIFIVDENPAKRLGNSLLWAGISLLSIGILPIFVGGSENFALKLVSDYMSESIFQQIGIAIALIVLGIILITLGKRKAK
jgi:hypothetical protein